MSKGDTPEQKVPRDLARKVAEEIMEAAKAILEKHGLDLTKTSSGYGDYFRLSIQASSLNLGKNDVNLDSLEAQEWIASAWRFDLTPESALYYLGEVCYTSEKIGECVLLGLNGRKTRTPILVRSLKTGAQYWIPEKALTIPVKANA